MSKWNKPQGVVVPLESLLKERRKENCPAPRRSAGLVGRWGITSFTSIRSRSYVAEYNNVDLKDATGLDLGTGDSPDSVVNLLGSNNTETVRPRKFFKSRNIIPPPPPPLPAPNEHLGHSPYAGNAGGIGYGAGTSDPWNQANATTTSPQQQQFYQPLSAAAATPQFSPTGPQSANVGLLPGGHVADGMGYPLQQQQLLQTLPVTKEKKPGRKKKTATAVAAAATVPTIDPSFDAAVPARKPATSKAPKKEKKEKRAKKSKKEPAAGEVEQEQPKRNSSRIRNRVVNYNEDEDSNDYERSVVARSTATNNHQHNAPFSTPEYGIPAPSADPSFAGVLEQQQQFHQNSPVPTAAAPYHPMVQRPVSSSSSPAGGYHSGGEGRYGAKPSTTVTTPLPSPSEHRPILLRISKGTSMLISTDSEEVSTNNSTPPTTTSNQHQHYNQQQPQSDQQAEDEDEDYGGNLPPRTLLAERGPTTTNLDSSVDYLKQHHQYNAPVETFTHATPPQPPTSCGEGDTPPADIQLAPVPKSELKIKISLGGKPLISSTTSSAPGSTTPNSNVGASGGKSTKSSSKYNFKKRAIEREKARSSHLSSKRSKADHSDSEQNQQNSSVATTAAIGAGAATVHSVSSSTASKEKAISSVPTVTRPSFPLPGTDTYEVFRTLSSLSGGDDFDSQSSILGSASSDNNTPKHTLAPGEDCQIIHSRGSSDCGSDLELSQNSSTAAAPPSDVYSESENTQDNNQQQQQQAAHHQPSRTAVVASSLSLASCTPTPSSSFVSEAVPPVDLLQHQQQPPQQQQPQPSSVERVEVLKLNLKNVTHGTRVTRNKMRHTSNLSDEQQSQQEQDPSSSPTKQLLLRVGRTGRNRSTAAAVSNNNNNVVRGSTVTEKRTRKQPEPVAIREEPATTEEQIMTETSPSIPSQPQGESVLNQQTAAPPTTTEPPAAVVSSAIASEAAAAGHKPSVTRQYSRRKKNVVPPDYLGEASSTGAPTETGSAVEKIDSSNSGVVGGDECEQEQQIALPLSLLQNGDMMGEQQVTSCTTTTRTPPPIPQEVTLAPAGVVAPPQPAASGPPAPMRLVLQKKGTIFKSRPMVGSSDGATDTKKRHVYKHKWDNDHGNGMMMDRDEQGAIIAGGGVVGSNPENANNLAGSGAAGAGGNAAGAVGGVGTGKMATDLTSSAYTTDGGCGMDGMEGDNHDGGSAALAASGAGMSSAGQLDYDGNFFDHDGPVAMPPRSKRLKTFAPSSNATGAGGSVGQTAGVGMGSAGGGGATGFSSMHYHQNRTQTTGSDEYDSGAADAFNDDAFGGDDEYGGGRIRQAKPFYTIVRNVKNSHQMQEIGEFQEMDDDVDYILSALHPDNPISTRCLSALQLATKCMKPAFKMHVRAHGVVTRFFRALSDAHQDPSLGLCTAAIMYVFSQDKLNMDLDRDSLELMLNLLDTDHKLDGTAHQQQGQLQKNRQRVKELCEEIKGAGKGKHIDTDRVTAGSLAMESLLSLTSQRAGEWFKDELRNLGGIEHLIKTVAECYEQVPGRASDWNEQDVAKLRKIERCLRVLNNVSLFNFQNQRFLLEHRGGLLVQILVRLYRQVDRDLMHYPTDDATPKESIGVLLRELLQPMLHMLITLTHAFNEEAQGAHLVGKQPDVINITMHLLLRISEYVPQRCVFDLHLLALTLLLHLARPSQHNRQQVLCYMDSETNRGGIKALVEYFEQQEEMASHAEAKTNAILETPARTVDAEDAETKLIQKAEHHMEHTYMGSHVCMLISQLVMGEPGLEQIARMHLKNNNFKRMVAALTRYYEFLNLTTNADAESTAHKRQTKEAIDYLGQLDGCESSGAVRTGTAAGTADPTIAPTATF